MRAQQRFRPSATCLSAASGRSEGQKRHIAQWQYQLLFTSLGIAQAHLYCAAGGSFATWSSRDPVQSPFPFSNPATPCAASRSTMRYNTPVRAVERAARVVKSRTHTYILPIYIVAEISMFDQDNLSTSMETSSQQSRRLYIPP